MKYIVIKHHFGSMSQETPIIFPEHLVHSIVADALMQSPILGLRKPEVVAAGEVQLHDAVCSGRSGSLHIDSRGVEDSRLIFGVDYGLGIKDA